MYPAYTLIQCNHDGDGERYLKVVDYGTVAVGAGSHVQSSS